MLDDKVPAAAANRQVIEAWLMKWQTRALAAIAGLAPIAARVPAAAVDLTPLLVAARAQQDKLLEAADLDAALLAELPS